MGSMTEIQTISKLTVVIFGVTGDLTSRKLIPALYQLLANEKPDLEVRIIGFARREWTKETLQETIIKAVQDHGKVDQSDPVLRKMVENAEYICANFDDPAGYQILKTRILSGDFPNVLYYLATPPDNYLDVIKNLGEAKLQIEEEGFWRRIIVEKPYGRDLQSALLLEDEIHNVFRESQIYRIDHYLGKETVQNILVFRFANGIFEPLWNRRYVDHIQIIVAEDVGIENRAGFYEKAGVIRDVFQNHILQLLALTAMEAPVAFNPNSVRDEKVKVLRSLKQYTETEALENTCRGQYTSGIIDGKEVNAYRDERGVEKDSQTETFLAAKVFIDNWRWSGVPFYIRSGKRLHKRITEIAIQFKQVPLALFNSRNMAFDAPNILSLNIQPDEGIQLSFGAKIPGHSTEVQPVEMKFSYTEAFGSEPPEAYVRLLLDCIQGDATLFTRSDEVIAAWSFTSRILDAWRNDKKSLIPAYKSGTWGPDTAIDFIKKDSRNWRFSRSGI
jgi:glucose-6-phosphate 1-dehydrogenase